MNKTIKQYFVVLVCLVFLISINAKVIEQEPSTYFVFSLQKFTRMMLQNSQLTRTMQILLFSSRKIKHKTRSVSLSSTSTAVLPLHSMSANFFSVVILLLSPVQLAFTSALKWHRRAADPYHGA